MAKAIISLTTISSRISRIYEVINSLLSQKSHVEVEVRLYVSREGFMLDQGIKNIPDTLSILSMQSNQFKIFFVENSGPYRKIIPVLKDSYLGLIECDYVVTADDDTLYPDYWLQSLVNINNKFDCVVAYRGRRISTNSRGFTPYETWQHSDESLLRPSYNTLGTGKDGILYKPNYFHDDVLDLEAALKIAPNADDLWLKYYTTINGARSVLVSSTLTNSFYDLGRYDDNTLYRKINKDGGNDKVMCSLQNYSMERYSKSYLDFFNADNIPNIDDA